jgi:hypothetical protein
LEIDSKKSLLDPPEIVPKSMTPPAGVLEVNLGDTVPVPRNVPARHADAPPYENDPPAPPGQVSAPVD